MRQQVKSAVITGAASGIGLALSARFVRAKSAVVMVDINRDLLLRRADELSGQGAFIETMTVDLTDSDAVEALAERAFEILGDIDVVFNNAGVLGLVGEPLWQTPLEQIRKVLDVNFWAHLHVSRAFVPRLLNRHRPSHVVHTASMSALVVGAGSAGYAASKHADLALARSLRADLEGTGIRVSVLCPGRVETPMVEGLTAPRRAGGATEVSADQVAEIVWDALGTDRFYLFVNPDTPARLHEQLDELLNYAALPVRVHPKE